MALVASLWAAHLVMAADAGPAAMSINQLGLELERSLAKGDNNLCLSPYSIQSAMTMVFAGADGATRTEMTKVLHYPNDDATIHDSFAALEQGLETAKAKSAERAKQSKVSGGPSEPLTLHRANRLFGQKGYQFQTPFLELLKDRYHAPLEELDFHSNPESAREHINGWVEEETVKRIRNLIPHGALTGAARLVLVNAVYLKAAWAQKFNESATQPAPFQIHGKTPADVPTMTLKSHFGFGQSHGYTELLLPYSGGGLNFLILLPEKPDGLRDLENKLSAEDLAQCTRLPSRELVLHLPKFKIESASIPLRPELESLGMKTAFDNPKGSANFDKIAPRRGNDYLYISDIFHKTFIAVDEQGTEAAAATAVAMMEATAIRKPPPEVRVDHPFLFAIQDAQSGACLFLGRVTDPR